MEKSEVQSVLQQASLVSHRKIALGLDSQQLAGTPAVQKADAGHILRPGEVVGSGPGYFKLSRGREGQVVTADGLKGDTLFMQCPIKVEMRLPATAAHARSLEHCLCCWRPLWKY